VCGENLKFSGEKSKFAGEKKSIHQMPPGQIWTQIIPMTQIWAQIRAAARTIMLVSLICSSLCDFLEMTSVEFSRATMAIAGSITGTEPLIIQSEQCGGGNLQTYLERKLSQGVHYSCEVFAFCSS
jgi:hypothetical protein